MISRNRKQNSKGSKNLVASGKNGITKTKPMSETARLMSTFTVLILNKLDEEIQIWLRLIGQAAVL